MPDNLPEAQNAAPDLAALAAFAFNEPIKSVDAIPTDGSQPPPSDIIPQPDQIIEPEAFIKEHFGMDNLDAVKTEWSRLQELSKVPPKSAIEFKDEQSKKIYAAILDGKNKEVRSYLDAQDLLENVDMMADEQKLKLFIKMNNPLYDQELIDAVYAKNYNFNETSFKDEEGVIKDPLAYRLAKIDALQKAQQDTIKANEYFQQYRSKIELPPINDKPAADDSYEAYKASNAQASDAYNKVTVPALRSLKETDIPLGFKVDDPNNQMQFDVSLAIDRPDFEKAVNNGLDYMGYTERSFYDEKGNFMPSKLVRALAIADNFDKYAQSIARQAVNAERKRVIEKETPGNPQQRDFSNVDVPDDLKKLEKLVFGN